MAITLDRLRTRRADQPPRILLYGPTGVGKTTLASEFPNPVFLDIEDGAPEGVEITGFDLYKDPSYQNVMGTIRLLYENRLPFDTVILDNATVMERLVFAETCARGDEHGRAKANIEDFGYGKGYINAQRVWSEFWDGLKLLRRDRGMAIVVIAHAKIKTFNDPESASYDRYEIDLHDKSRTVLDPDMDAILLLKSKVSLEKEEQGFNKERVVAKGNSQVWIHANHKPSYVAKNRYGIQDTLYKRGSGFASMASKLPPFGQPQDARELSDQADAA